MLRLQGFPETFKIVVSYQAMRKLAGNSVAIPVIEAVASNIIEAIQQLQPKQSKKVVRRAAAMFPRPSDAAPTPHPPK